MLLDVCKVVLLWKLDVGSSLERSFGQVMEKVPEMMPNGRPRDAFWSTLGLGKRHRHVQKESFGMRMSGVYFRHPPVPHFLRNHVEMAGQKSCLDCTGTSGSHICRFLKKSSPGQLFQRFRRCFGGPAEPLGRLFPQKTVKCGRWLRSRFRSYGNHRNPPEPSPD